MYVFFLRYCAKLPSDAFTHLTPKCTVLKVADDPPQYTASLQLPINSPIKEIIKVNFKTYKTIMFFGL